ncbi:MAG: quinone oxidoreductase [Spirochaeta sp.]|jgi:NADPH2:quinone reductase|nr:quinone oxidoreductase [Spirochaeta sp.]
MPKSVQFTTHGGPDVLSVVETPKPEPGAGEVRVRLYAAGLNYIDTYHRTGYYPVPSLPSGIGLEGAGVIDAIGPDVNGWSAGQRVAFVVTSLGTYAEYRTVPADRLVALPDEIEFEQAAGMMLKGMTARYLLRQTYPVSSEDTILVHAAAGGVGLILCQWAAYLGVTVIGTVGSPEKAELARENGCSYPVLYREEDVVDRVREITGGAGVAVVYDSVGRDTMEQSLQCLRQRGLLVSFGQSSGAVEGFDPVMLSRHGSLFLTRPSLFHYVASREELEENAGELFSVVRSGDVTIPVRQRYTLEEAAEAHRALEARETTGSTVFVIN